MCMIRVDMNFRMMELFKNPDVQRGPFHLKLLNHNWKCQNPQHQGMSRCGFVQHQNSVTTCVAKLSVQLLAWRITSIASLCTCNEFSRSFYEWDARNTSEVISANHWNGNSWIGGGCCYSSFSHNLIVRRATRKEAADLPSVAVAAAPKAASRVRMKTWCESSPSRTAKTIGAGLEWTRPPLNCSCTMWGRTSPSQTLNFGKRFRLESG